MARYKLTESGVYDKNKNLFIPSDTRNRDFIAYQNWVNEGNTPDPIYSGSEKKEMKKFELNEARKDYLEKGTIEFDGNVFATDQETRDNLSGVVAFVAAGSSVGPNFTWRDVSNNDVGMNDSDVTEFGAALVAHVNTAYKKNWTLKAQVDTIDDDDPEIDSKLEDIAW